MEKRRPVMTMRTLARNGPCPPGPYPPGPHRRAATVLFAGVLAISVVPAAPVTAALVEMTFSGQVTEILGAPHGQWANVVLGDDFMVRIVVDSKAEDLDPGGVGLYAYESATITVGGYSVTTGTGPLNSILIARFGGLFGNDWYKIEYHNPDEQWQGGISLQGPNVFRNDLLPLDLDLEAFTFYRSMSLGLVESESLIRAFPTQYSYRFIPHPGVLPLFTSALFLPRRRRRDR